MDHLWERLPDEQTKHWIAFNDYKNLGIRRSYDKLLAMYATRPRDETPTVQRKTVAAWGIRFEWVKRTNAWDEHQNEQRYLNRADAQIEIEDRELHDYLRQVRKWEEMFDTIPLHEVTAEEELLDGNHVKHLKLNTDDYLKMARLRDEITKQGRRALGLPKEFTAAKHEVTGKDGKPIQHDVIDVSDSERIARIAAILERARQARDGQTDSE